VGTFREIGHEAGADFEVRPLNFRKRHKQLREVKV
jgi:hypothetical protein